MRSRSLQPSRRKDGITCEHCQAPGNPFHQQIACEGIAATASRASSPRYAVLPLPRRPRTGGAKLTVGSRAYGSYG